MGKTTLFHPVSLQTIRGAAIQCGFVLSEIRQIAYSTEENEAFYRAIIVIAPVDFYDLSQENQKSMLQECFLDDIAVSWVGRNVKGQTCANFATMVQQDTPAE